jgi:glycosyltransferase involved in cell wall biosynthesis
MGTMGKIHVTILASCHRIGGFETKLDCLIRHLDRDRFRITVLLIYPFYKARKVPDEVRDRHKSYLHWKGIQNIELCMKYRYDFTIIWRVIQILKKSRADILYFLALGSGTFIAPLAGWAAGVPSLVRAGDTILDGLYPKTLKWMDKFLFSRTDIMIVPAAFLKNYYIKNLNVPSNKITVIPNSIDLTVFGKKQPGKKLEKEMGIKHGTKVIGMIANLLPVKAHTVLIKAIPLIIQQHPNTKFLLIGEGPLQEELDKLSQQLGVPDSIQFLGYRTDVSELIPLFDIGVLCSEVEIHPYSLLEIMASGIPVIAPCVGGIPEIITHEKEGLLVKQGDSNQLAGAILRLLKDPDHAKELGRKGREKVFNLFSTEKMIHSTETVFTSLMG